ncbi:tryptophan synthase beta subunit-like PLP-dependent enzyme [Aspergillus filifer]
MAHTPLTIQTATMSIQAHTRLKPHLSPTPLLPSRQTPTLLFKCENFQKTSSFKIRGAMNKILLSPPGTKLITASSGNHGIGAACAARILGREGDLTVVLPRSVVPVKKKAVEGYGVKVLLWGSETGAAERYARGLAGSELEESEGEYTYISPYNDEQIVAGQGTIALEVLEQCGGLNVDSVFVVMGGGGLVSGIGAVAKVVTGFTRMRTKVYGVAASQSKALAEAMSLGRVVDVPHGTTLADAVAGGIDVDTITLPLAVDVVDEMVECDEDEIKDALRILAWDENMIVEGSAALAFAVLRKVAKARGPALDGKTSVVLCGANYDRDILQGVLC